MNTLPQNPPAQRLIGKIATSKRIVQLFSILNPTNMRLGLATVAEAMLYDGLPQDRVDELFEEAQKPINGSVLSWGTASTVVYVTIFQSSALAACYRVVGMKRLTEMDVEKFAELGRIGMHPKPAMVVRCLEEVIADVITRKRKSATAA